MGWFDEQIKQRKISDDEQFQDSFIRMAGAVMGAKAESALKDERARAKNAIDEILKYYHYKLQDVPAGIRMPAVPCWPSAGIQAWSRP